MNKVSFKKCFQTPEDGHYFFGYYNKPQVSADDSKLLALKIKSIDSVPAKHDEAEVGWFDLNSDDLNFHVIGKTNSYNWQQGAMLQFLGPDFNHRIIWNTFEDREYCSKIYNFEDQSLLTRPAIYDVCKDGLTATTIDFERHTWCRRGYSYGNIYKEEKNRKVVAGDGIWKVNLLNGEKKQIVLIEDMIANKEISTMDGATHYLEHMLFNPNGEYFTFLHRWRHSHGIHSRLYICDQNGKNVKIINDSGRMSHYCWLSNHEILAYGALPNPINSLRKHRRLVKTLFRWLIPIYKYFIHDTTVLAKRLTGDSYMILDIKNHKLNRKILPKFRSSDGHPTMIENSDDFFTDTYARSVIDEKPKLIKVSLLNDNVEIIDELKSIAEFDETPLRCDLHPRISPSGNIISIDTMNDGVRSCYAYIKS